jgi:hypothetical protein
MYDWNCVCTQKLAVYLQGEPDKIPMKLPKDYPNGYDIQSGTTLCLVMNKLPFIQGDCMTNFVDQSVFQYCFTLGELAPG